MTKKRKVFVLLLIGCLTVVFVVIINQSRIPKHKKLDDSYLGNFNILPRLEVGEIDIFNDHPVEEPVPFSDEKFWNLFKHADPFSLIESGNVDQLIERFGYPEKFHTKFDVVSYKYHPNLFYMHYAVGVKFHIYNETIMQIDVEKPGFFINGIQVGSSYDDALENGINPVKVHDFSIRKIGIYNSINLDQHNILPGDMILFGKNKLLLYSKRPVRYYFINDVLDRISFHKAKYYPTEGIYSYYGDHSDLSQLWWYKLTSAHTCLENMKKINEAMLNYAEVNEGIYPLMQNAPAPLTFDLTALFPTQHNEQDFFKCPEMDLNNFDTVINDQKLFESSYWYIGYAFANERDGIGFLAAYYDSIGTQALDERELILPKRANAGTVGKLYKLRDGAQRPYIREVGNPAQSEMVKRFIPILIEKPGHHSRMGGHVLYMDGHVEWRDYPGPFPMTPAFIEGLYALEERLKQEYPEAFE